MCFVRSLTLLVPLLTAGCIAFGPGEAIPPETEVVRVSVVHVAAAAPARGLRVLSTFEDQILDAGVTGPDGSTFLRVADDGELTASVANDSSGSRYAVTLGGVRRGRDYTLSWTWGPYAGAAVGDVPVKEVVVTLDPAPVPGTIEVLAGYCSGMPGAIDGQFIVGLNDSCRDRAGASFVFAEGVESALYAAAPVGAATTALTLSLQEVPPVTLSIRGSFPSGWETPLLVTAGVAPMRVGSLAGLGYFASPGGGESGGIDREYSVRTVEADALQWQVELMNEDFSEIEVLRRTPATTTSFALESAFGSICEIGVSSSRTRGRPNLHREGDCEGEMSLFEAAAPGSTYFWRGVYPGSRRSALVPPIPDFDWPAQFEAGAMVMDTSPTLDHFDHWELETGQLGAGRDLTWTTSHMRWPP
jgi:hypothetical protein